MGRAFGLVLLMVLGAIGVPAARAGQITPPVRTRVIRGQSGKHTYVVRLVQGPFRRFRHRIKQSGYHVWMDGKPEWGSGTTKNWYGTDGGLPNTEFYAFEVTVDGKRWRVPSRLYEDCYEPDLGNVTGTLSPDGARLTLKMHGSDGAGSYDVQWHLRSDGKHSRGIGTCGC